MIGIHYFSRLVIVQVHYREMTSHDASSSLIAGHLASSLLEENEHLNGLKVFFLANYYLEAWIVITRCFENHENARWRLVFEQNSAEWDQNVQKVLW